MKNQIINYGSYDSTEKDVCIIIPRPINQSEVYTLCSEIKGMNAIAACVNNGVVSWCSSGVVDEYNNAILSTYHFHRQKFPCPITKFLKRDVLLKISYIVNSLNSFLSNPFVDVSKINNEILILNSYEFDLFCKSKFKVKEIVHEHHKNNLKFFAFQFIQLHSLLNKGVEIFTKDEAISYEPLLKGLIRRESCSCSILDDYKDALTDLIKKSFNFNNELLVSYDKKCINSSQKFTFTI